MPAATQPEFSARPLFEECYDYNEAALIRAAGIYPFFQVLSASDGPVVSVDGREVVMLGSNNYIGLTHHPEVMRAAHEAIDRFGTGCTGSRFLNGNLELHQTLEAELADFVGKEAALVFSSGFLANAGTIAALGCIPGAVIFSERENHASLIDGTRLGKCDVRVFDSPEDLERQLAERESWPNALVVTDAVFSMTGRVMDLTRIAELRRRFGFRLYVDDAHGIGVLGKQGRGTASEQGVIDEVDLLFGTFSKSLASLGGFVAGEAAVLDWLRHKSRTMIFSAALPPASAAAALAALRVLRRDDDLLVRLRENAAFWREGLKSLGYCTLGSRTPIVPVFVGSESLSFRMCKDLLDLGVFATPVAFPAVPYGQALIRTSTTPAHTREHLTRGLEAFAKLAGKYPIPEVDEDNLPMTGGIDFTYAFEQ